MWMTCGMYYNSSVQLEAAAKNWLVMVVLTLMQFASGKERFGVLQSICCAWMFDEGTGIKSQECAGIQILCEYIISSIIPPYDCTPGLARQSSDRRGFAAPSTSEQPTLLKPTASLWRTPPPSPLSNLSAFPAVSARKHILKEEKKICGLMTQDSFRPLCTSPSYWI